MFRIPVKISTLEVVKANVRLVGGVRSLATPPAPSSSSSGPSGSSEPPPGRSGGSLKSKLFITLLGATALTGATLAYAKSNQDFRDFLKEQAPWTDDAIAYMYLERDLPGTKFVNDTKDLVVSASRFIYRETAPPPIPSESSLMTNLSDKPRPKPVPKATETPSLPVITPIKVDLESEKSTSKVPVEVSHENCRDPNKLPKVNLDPPSDGCGVMQELPICEEEGDIRKEEKLADEAKCQNDNVQEAAEKAKNAVEKATIALREYGKYIVVVMETCEEGGIGHGLWENLRKTTRNKVDAEMQADKALKELDDMCGAVAEKARRDLKEKRTAYENARTDASVASRYWPQVEEARRHFVDELEILFPRVDVSCGQLDTRGGDTDALLLLALRRVLLYQQMMAKTDTVLSNRISEKLSGTSEDIIMAKVDMEMEKERRELAIVYQKKALAAHLEAEKELADQLKRQLEIHTMHLQDALDFRTEQVSQFERRIAEEKAQSEKASQGIRLAAMLGRLQGVDDALKLRSDADKMARKSQVLWAASEALEGVLRGRGLAHHRMNLSRELEAIASAAADSDELVAVVLRGIPVAARERGVLTEVALRERFLKLEQVCRSVAMVPACGARLPVYILSWLQGVFLVSTNYQSTHCKGGADVPEDFSKLDTYEILIRARYWVERGHWAQALRYMQLLKGAPQSIARDWTEEAALHLEARQAAAALLAHASATGLLYL